MFTVAGLHKTDSSRSPAAGGREQGAIRRQVMVEEVAVNKSERSERKTNAGEGSHNSGLSRLQEEFLNDRLSSRSNTQGTGDSNSMKSTGAPDLRQGIITTYDENGNPTSDCNGPLPRRGGGHIDLPSPYPGRIGRPEPLDGSLNTRDRAPHNEKELDNLSKDIADKLGDGRWKFGTPEEKEQLLNQLKAAEERGDLKLLVAKVNEELARKGSELHLDLKVTHKQDDYWPELNPFTSWKHYDVNLTAEEGSVLDNLDFDGKEVHHPGRYR